MKRYRLSALAFAVLLALTACSPRLEAADPGKITENETIRVADESNEDGLPYSSVYDLSALSQENVGGMLQQTATSYKQIDLSFPQTFAITRPTDTLTTTFSSYFITGTSDPSQPVYFDGEEIERQGIKGAFGVHVDLQMGTNTFSFSQGGKSTTVTIKREAQPGTQAITGLVQSSIYPSVQGSAKAGGDLLVEATAPSGATVTASFGGQTTTLEQVATASTGIPATYRGTIKVGTDYPAGRTTNAGKIKYTMNYNGSSKNYESTGDVFIAGAGSEIAVEVDGYIGFVLVDSSNAGNFREKLKGGASDYVESQTNSFFKLASGGYISTSAVRIIEGNSSIENSFSNVSFSSGSNYESYTFTGTNTPAYLTSADTENFSITFYNTSGTPQPDVSSSHLFSSASVKDNGSSVTYTFQKKGNGNLWGYNVSYDGNNTVVRVAYKPAISSGSQPLSGVTIVLDPGHGDHDPGAAGIAGKTGPDENVANLAHALATKSLLEEKGAKVLLTRSSLDEFLELDERLEFFENSGADLFISLHHNSLMESTNANTVNGLEIYYHSSLSRNFANKMMASLESGTGRRNRSINQSYYRVTMIPYAPSILTELGYMCNPLEYEKITTQSEVERTAQALVNGIINTLS